MQAGLPVQLARRHAGMQRRMQGRTPTQVLLAGARPQLLNEPVLPQPVHAACKGWLKAPVAHAGDCGRRAPTPHYQD